AEDRGSGVAREAAVAEVRLRRRQVVGREVGDIRHPAAPDPEQRTDRALRLAVVALAELDVAYLAAPVDQALGRPVLVPVRGPRAVVVVLDDRVADAEAVDRAVDVRR